jgi:hypothetical protein
MVKKRSKSSAKGSSFEREVCRQLSLWWTNQERDDIFWRASQSGGRATTRAKRGKSTANSAGDVAYLDVIGKPFLDKVCIEIKRGYSTRSDTTGLIDSPSTSLLFKFLEQAECSRLNANVPYWMLIQKRDRRVPIIHIPSKMMGRLNNFLGKEKISERFDFFQFTIVSYGDCSWEIVSVPLVDFLGIVPTDFFKAA